MATTLSDSDMLLSLSAFFTSFSFADCPFWAFSSMAVAFTEPPSVDSFSPAPEGPKYNYVKCTDTWFCIMILITIKNSKTFGLAKEIIVEEDKQNDVARLKQKNKDKKQSV